jgi:hypothetical protein
VIERSFFGAGARHTNNKHYAVSFLWFFRAVR